LNGLMTNSDMRQVIRLCSLLVKYCWIALRAVIMPSVSVEKSFYYCWSIAIWFVHKRLQNRSVAGFRKPPLAPDRAAALILPSVLAVHFMMVIQTISVL